MTVKLLRYGPAQRERPGLLDAQGRIRDLSAVVPDIAGPALGPESLRRLAELDPAQLPLVTESVRIGPCVGSVGKFVCIGLNYVDHIEESGQPVPAEPVVFFKATSAICGPNDDVIKPRDAAKLDWEVELGLVIGRQARYVGVEEALRFVAGYCVVNDVSERVFQLERGGAWDKGKSCDTFGPIGPWLVTKDEVEDPGNLSMWLEVNGKRYQSSSTQAMIFGPAFIVSYVSRFMSLCPGDVIATGTPAGVGLGQRPPRFLEIGDVMTLGLTGLGEQRQRIVQEEMISRA